MAVFSVGEPGSDSSDHWFLPGSSSRLGLEGKTDPS